MLVSLKMKSLIFSCISIVVVGLSLSVYNFKNISNTIEESVNQQVDTTGQLLSSSMEYWLRSKFNAMNSFVDIDSDKQHITNLIKQIEVSGGFYNVFLAYPDGTQINSKHVQLDPAHNDPREWPWYQNVNKFKEDIFVSDPTPAAGTTDLVISMSKSIFNSGRFVSVLGVDVPIHDFINQLVHVSIPGNGYAFMVSNANIITAHPDKNYTLKNIESLLPSISNDLQNNSEHYLRYVHDGKDLRVYKYAIGNTNQTIYFIADNKALKEPLYHQLFINLLVLLFVVSVVVAVYYVVFSKLFSPLTQIHNQLRNIANGTCDLTKRLNVVTNDDIGLLSLAFNEFVEGLQFLLLDISKNSNLLESQSQSTAVMSNNIQQLLFDQNREISGVATAILEMSTATANISELTNSTAEITSFSVVECKDGQDIFSKTAKLITNLDSKINETSSIISKLESHTKNIDKILLTIENVADQTTLLALNAAIEAARAGEHGRGFAVVADEVRVLSQKTSQSTSEIQETINDLKSITVSAVNLMTDCTELALFSVKDIDTLRSVLASILNTFIKINDMTTHIATAAEEQTHVTADITKQISFISDVANDASNLGDECGKTSNSMADRVNELKSLVARFHV
ncbi:methyl-accepting chemotaxis protein [uncultured Tolumonas sp.]|uniref:methyl-accepting chemotaxis protein n=1 Tax=uncultured Tolumonas sp. TaxID=263765 RepID=UPI002930AFEC|nr:methyl-accepting chemotaxis protein [uncultured Tolumonas sp.]